MQEPGQSHWDEGVDVRRDRMGKQHIRWTRTFDTHILCDPLCVLLVCACMCAQNLLHLNVNVFIRLVVSLREAMLAQQLTVAQQPVCVEHLGR